MGEFLCKDVCPLAKGCGKSGEMRAGLTRTKEISNGNDNVGEITLVIDKYHGDAEQAQRLAIDGVKVGLSEACDPVKTVINEIIDSANAGKRIDISIGPYKKGRKKERRIECKFIESNKNHVNWVIGRGYQKVEQVKASSSKGR